MAKEVGASVTYVDLKDFEMPLYDGDFEEQNGVPENAIKLKKLFVEHDGFFIASPEYNSSMSPLLKNSLDWISRPHEKNEVNLIAFMGKVAGLVWAKWQGLVRSARAALVVCVALFHCG